MGWCWSHSLANSSFHSLSSLTDVPGIMQSTTSTFQPVLTTTLISAYGSGELLSFVQDLKPVFFLTLVDTSFSSLTWYFKKKLLYESFDQRSEYDNVFMFISGRMFLVVTIKPTYKVILLPHISVSSFLSGACITWCSVRKQTCPPTSTFSALPAAVDLTGHGLPLLVVHCDFVTSFK